MKIISQAGLPNEWHANKFDRFLFWYSAIVTPLIAIFAIMTNEEGIMSVLVWIAMTVVANMTLVSIYNKNYISKDFIQKFGYCLAWFVFVTTAMGFLVGLMA